MLERTLPDMVRDLLDRYAEDDAPAGPGLLERLDNLALRTEQPRGAGGHAAPGSRPPASLDAVHWSTRIKTEAVVLDRTLRRSNVTQTWQKAVAALPQNAEAADQVRAVTSTVGMWHSTCRTVLGLQLPSMHFRGVACLACGQCTIQGRAEDKPRAWCTNPDCMDGDTGRPARYERQRLWLLTTNLRGLT